MAMVQRAKCVFSGKLGNFAPGTSQLEHCGHDCLNAAADCSVADQKFPLFVEVTHFQAQDEYLLQNMTDGVWGGSTEAFSSGHQGSGAAGCSSWHGRGAGQRSWQLVITAAMEERYHWPDTLSLPSHTVLCNSLEKAFLNSWES
ncbi:hypothetical protein Anapl_08804 [Anas platyrhynchos]|uniref:Uncharacterized protein n=1 Tax=Anas platyrhynchos TaxID=8839 RepID=R0LAE8_ANAPL|nr:hypothetical protein Anapl_08804 [Anas platyrhynchos]